MQMADERALPNVVSHRSGETEELHRGSRRGHARGQIKTGSGQPNGPHRENTISYCASKKNLATPRKFAGRKRSIQ